MELTPTSKELIEFIDGAVRRNASSVSSPKARPTPTSLTNKGLRRPEWSVLSRPITDAVEKMLDIGDSLSLWYRTWGTPGSTAVLFVHGGPGKKKLENCVRSFVGLSCTFSHSLHLFLKRSFYIRMCS